MSDWKAQILLKAEQLLKDGEPDEAAQICNKLLNEDPDDAYALFVLARCFTDAGRFGLCVTIYRRILDIKPLDPPSWNNLGLALYSIQNMEEAERCFLKAIELDPYDSHAYHNMTALKADQCNPTEALRYGDLACHFGNEEQRRDSQKNTSMPLLGLGRWYEGWRAFDAHLGSKWRRDRQYAKEGYWNGKPGQTVVFGAEQGLGDEILFSSMLPDALNDTHGIIECDYRLEGLFRRSFPQATIYGTRHDKKIDWPRFHQIDARCPMGSLGKFYRNRAENFPREPYLIACPDRRRMYHDMLAKLPGRKIGIAWTGGTKITRTDIRSLSIEDVEAFVRRFPNDTFISLEYKGNAVPDGVHYWPWITRTQDYDDTAALVAELDCVVSVTTTVALLAGALGVNVQALVPLQPTWHWGYEGAMPWFPISLHRGDIASSLAAMEDVLDGH